MFIGHISKGDVIISQTSRYGLERVQAARVEISWREASSGQSWAECSLGEQSRVEQEVMASSGSHSQNNKADFSLGSRAEQTRRYRVLLHIGLLFPAYIAG